MARDVLKAARSASNAISVTQVGRIRSIATYADQVTESLVLQKYTVQSTGIWERVRRILSLDPNRSTGIPLNAQFRLPTPGSVPPLSYDDPVTVPAGDIADNPYWKRDMRRNYPKLSTVSQADAVGLLTVGSKAAPKEDVLQIGEAGEKQLVAVKEAGEERGLAALFEKNKKSIQGVLGANGLPPSPCNLNNATTKYEIDEEQSYPEK